MASAASAVAILWPWYAFGQALATITALRAPFVLMGVGPVSRGRPAFLAPVVPIGVQEGMLGGRRFRPPARLVVLAAVSAVAFAMGLGLGLGLSRARAPQPRTVEVPATLTEPGPPPSVTVFVQRTVSGGG